MKVRDLMTAHSLVISPETTLQEAAELMEFIHCGMLPVGVKGELEGVITDRDMVIRAVAKGKDPCSTAVGEYMTPRVCTCFDDDDLEVATLKMRTYRVSRLIVRNRGGGVAGILSLGGILRREADSLHAEKIIRQATGLPAEQASN